MASLPIMFNRGLNSQISWLTDAPGHCLTFADYQLDYGMLHPRTSMAIVNQSVIGSSSNKLDAVGFWVAPSQATFGTMNGNLYINDATAGKFYRSLIYPQTANGSVTVTDITNAIAQNTAPITFASLNGILVYTGVGGHVNQITSSVANCATVAGVSAAFTMVRTVNNIMFGAVGAPGVGATNSTVYWSAVNDPTTWPVASNITFRNNDGDSVQALGELNGNLLIFKQLSIGLLSTISTVVSGTTTLGPLTTLFQGIGCVGPNAVDTLPDGTCIFVGTDSNIYRTDGASLVALTNNPPPDINIVQAILDVGVFSNSVYLRYTPFRNEIVFAGINGANVAFCFVYDMIQQYWRKITGVSPYALCVLKNPSLSGVTSLLIAGNNLGNVIDIQRGNNATPTNQDGTIPSPDISASVSIPQNYFSSNLVCLTILYRATQPVSFRYGFDNAYGSSRTLPSTSTRADLKIQLRAATNNQRPSTFQINFTDNGNSGAGQAAFIEKVMLSDEVTA